MEIVCTICLPESHVVKGLSVDKNEEYLYVLTYDLRDIDNSRSNIIQIALNQTINEEMDIFEGTITHQNSLINKSLMYVADIKGSFSSVSMDIQNDLFFTENEVNFNGMFVNHIAVNEDETFAYVSCKSNSSNNS